MSMMKEVKEKEEQYVQETKDVGVISA